eukprot:scaffold13633_cov64-Phaeocystis_antarctica.AAC.11
MRGSHCCGPESPEALFAVRRLKACSPLTAPYSMQKAPTCARAMPHFPVRESHRLAALFVDPREHAVVGRALHMLVDDVEHRAQAIILCHKISGAVE